MTCPPRSRRVSTARQNATKLAHNVPNGCTACRTAANGKCGSSSSSASVRSTTCRSASSSASTPSASAWTYSDSARMDEACREEKLDSAWASDAMGSSDCATATDAGCSAAPASEFTANRGVNHRSESSQRRTAEMRSPPCPSRHSSTSRTTLYGSAAMGWGPQGEVVRCVNVRAWG